MTTTNKTDSSAPHDTKALSLAKKLLSQVHASSEKLEAADVVASCFDYSDLSEMIISGLKALITEIEELEDPAINGLNTASIAIYDKGEKSGERYTVFPYAFSHAASDRRVYLGMSEGGVNVSMWGELPEGQSRGPYLGKIVKFDSLSLASKRHIAKRLQE